MVCGTRLSPRQARPSRTETRLLVIDLDRPGSRRIPYPARCLTRGVLLGLRGSGCVRRGIVRCIACSAIRRHDTDIYVTYRLRICQDFARREIRMMLRSGERQPLIEKSELIALVPGLFPAWFMRSRPDCENRRTSGADSRSSFWAGCSTIHSSSRSICVTYTLRRGSSVAPIRIAD